VDLPATLFVALCGAGLFALGWAFRGPIDWAKDSWHRKQAERWRGKCTAQEATIRDLLSEKEALQRRLGEAGDEFWWNGGERPRFWEGWE
jgi:hypothetical protein